jgi:DNA repair exonuclease SbcCD ATPase subunit
MNPLSINIKNFFSHEDSDLDFNFKSCLLIGNTEGDYTRSNGSGKSAIFESMLWALFNKSRAPKMDDLVRWGETVAQVSFEFESDQSRYRIIRSRNKKNSLSEVTFEKFIEEEWKDISGSTSSLTNKAIEDTIKLDYKTFLNTTYFRQNDASEFAEAEPFKRKEILKSIVNINKWDEWENNAKVKIKELKTDIKILDSKAEEAKILEEKVRIEKDKLKDLYEKLEELTKSVESEEKSYEMFLEEFLIQKRNLDSSSVAESESELKDLKIRLSNYSKKLLIAESGFEKAISNIDKCDAEIQNIEAFLLEKTEIPVDKSKLNIARNKISDLKSSKRFFEMQILDLNLKTLEEGECSSCGSEISSSFLENFEKQKALKIKELSEKKEDANSELKFEMMNLKELEETVRVNDLILKKKEALNFVLEKKEAFSSDKNKQDIDRLSLKDSISEVESLIKLNEEKISSLKNSDFKDSESKLEKKKRQLDSFRERILNVKQSIGISEANSERYSERLEELAKTKQELYQKQSELEDYQYLKNVFGKNGIQTILLENVIKNHQHIANEVLKDICNEPIYIHLDTQKSSSDGSRTLETLDLKIRKDGNVLDYDLLSGGEKFRISLALALGLRELAARFGGANLNLIMLDEVNSPLDRYGVETLFVNVIEKISERYKTMVITHDESLKERFSSVIDVTKINGISSINLNLSE